MTEPSDPSSPAPGSGDPAHDPAYVVPPAAWSAHESPDPFGMAQPPLAAGPNPILVSFGPPTQQRRLTIAFRLILLIPQLVVLWALGVAAEVITFIGWFAALFTGRLPDWAHAYLTGFLRWQTRVYAYLYFLTDSYPPFSLDDEPYPVRLATARSGLNRLAVLFRLILMFPAAFASGTANVGVGVAAFFIWLIALITGRLPEALHRSLASVVRYQARYFGYALMLTGVYPAGLFGDPVGPAPTAVAVGAASGSPDTEAFGTESAVAVLAPAEQPPAVAEPWRLTLSSAARNLVGLFLALGLLTWIGYAVLIGILVGSAGTTVSNSLGLASIQQAYNGLASSTVKFETAAQACGGQLTCVTAQDRKEAGYLQTFAGAVRAADLQGQPAADANSLISDADGSAQSLLKLATATTVAQYESALSTTGIEQQLSSVDSDYQRLIHDMTGGS